jgi:hypothetical protein
LEGGKEEEEAAARPMIVAAAGDRNEAHEPARATEKRKDDLYRKRVGMKRNRSGLGN